MNNFNEAITVTGSDGLSHRIVDVTDRQSAQSISFDFLNVVQWAPALLTGTERLFLYTLVCSIRPSRYLEIGVRFGGASLIVAKAMDAVNHDGRLVLVDPAPEMDPAHWDQIKHRSILVRGRSPLVLPEAREKAGGPFDLVFIDGQHSALAVSTDINNTFQYAADGAYVLFHDSFRDNIASAIDVFVSQHSHVVLDFGVVTREFTRNKGKVWCGFRLLQIRRRHRRWSMVSLGKHWYMRLLYTNGRALHRRVAKNIRNIVRPRST